jgi:hypothetical protein
MPSSPDVAIRFPSGLYTADQNPLSEPVRVNSFLPIPMSLFPTPVVILSLFVISFNALEAHDHEPWVADYIHSNLLILKEGFSVIQR